MNSICSSAWDIDDGHRLAIGHPGAVVIPAAIAVAETARKSGKELRIMAKSKDVITQISKCAY